MYFWTDYSIKSELVVCSTEEVTLSLLQLSELSRGLALPLPNFKPDIVTSMINVRQVVCWWKTWS